MSKLFIKNKYGQIPNSILNNPDLSFRAKGLWAYMQSKPDGWSFSVERITQQTREGKSAIRESMKELEKHRLLRREPTKNAVGKWNGYNYTLYEKPFADIRLTEKPSTGNYDTFSNKDKVIKNIKKEYSQATPDTIFSAKKVSKQSAAGGLRKRTDSHIPYKDIIEYLNTKLGTNYKYTTKITKQYIKARWEEGFRLSDFMKVIDNKYADWHSDVKMRRYLRPVTLFNNKFESYLNENNEEFEADNVYGGVD